MRLQKYMAHSGAASRRKSEEYILEGRVKVNDEIVKELGYIVDPEKDRVYLDGKRLKIIKKHTYILLNKPLGVVSTASDEKGRRTVIDLVENDSRLYPVGRLDIDTTGLILLTDDGEVTNKLTHPKNIIEKKYIATVEGRPNKNELNILRKGVMVGREKYAPAKVKILKAFEKDSIIEVVIHEGKNHQVKLMFEKINHPVKKLKRISIGDLELGDLEVGNYRYLNEEEVKYLKKLK
ncbi:pseudouridine synthase [Anaerosphaera multitolerans]|uniref:Pseudouridine synthase n=1 Tax=Anaerosphaera multitolerans TaxID=2487351 RepID=A0A437S7C8_9FIRM|nr:pseudouridine synthase [Anaerosphaera multitolerans]RVU54946.1 rRNA pseudouridine synthase [Anaerosphaera multitolerans]